MTDHLDFVSEILKSYGVHIHADILRSGASLSDSDRANSNEQVTLQLWKATHDVVVLALFLKSDSPLGPADIRLSWKQFASRGTDAIKFDAIKSFVRLQLAGFGFPRKLSSSANSRDLLISFVWLLANCELVERYTTNICRNALESAPFVAVRGHRTWCSNPCSPHATQHLPLFDEGTTGSSTKTVQFATHRISSQCGSLWHAVREMAGIEERRTLLLQRLCEHQARLRPPTSRLLLPVEIDVGIANDQALKKNKLDGQIQLMRSAVEATEKAVEFWKWCQTTLLTPIPAPHEGEGKEGEIEERTTQSDKRTAVSSGDRVSVTLRHREGNSSKKIDKIAENQRSLKLMEAVERMIEDLGLVLRTP
jgi:hypothetical protein